MATLFEVAIVTAGLTALALTGLLRSAATAQPIAQQPAACRFDRLEFMSDRTWYGPTPQLTLLPDGMVELTRDKWLNFDPERDELRAEPFGPTRSDLTCGELLHLQSLVSAVDWAKVSLVMPPGRLTATWNVCNSSQASK